MTVTDQDRRRALDSITCERAIVIAEAGDHPTWERLLILRTGPYLRVRLIRPAQLTPHVLSSVAGAAVIIDRTRNQAVRSVTAARPRSVHWLTGEPTDAAATTAQSVSTLPVGDDLLSVAA